MKFQDVLNRAAQFLLSHAPLIVAIVALATTVAVVAGSGPQPNGCGSRCNI